ncbi:uncharacterized protein METZ01_LOCUS38130, partial [marine metagenome]
MRGTPLISTASTPVTPLRSFRLSAITGGSAFWATHGGILHIWLTEGHFLGGYGRATASHLASIHASEAFPDRTGYSPAANTPDAVNRHIVN